MTLTIDSETTKVLVSTSDDYKYLKSFSELPDSALVMKVSTGRVWEPETENTIRTMPNPAVHVSAETVPTTVSMTAGPVLTFQIETTEREELVMDLFRSIEEDYDGIEDVNIEMLSDTESVRSLAERVEAYVAEVTSE